MTLTDLATDYAMKQAAYNALAMMGAPDNISERVSADMARRLAMRRMMAAEDAYYKALDAELASVEMVKAAG